MTPLRRALVVPAVLGVEVAVLALAPLLLAAAAVAALAGRSSRPLRTTLLVIRFASVEAALLPRLLGRLDDPDALVRQTLQRGHDAMCRILDVRLEIEDGSVRPQELDPTRPLVVLARHCGPGDSLFIAWLLAVHYRRRIHVVLKRTLRLEPTLDLASDHLPLCFVRGGDGRGCTAVGELAGRLAGGDALLLFPEGGNFSRPRWRRAVRALAREGHFGAARRALRRPHTLPPRLGGTAAALAAAPDADVLLLAHSGLGSAGGERPWWRLPVHHVLAVRTLLVPAARVPRTQEAIAPWLDDAWGQVDTWVDSRVQLEGAVAPPAGAPPRG